MRLKHCQIKLAASINAIQARSSFVKTTACRIYLTLHKTSALLMLLSNGQLLSKD